MEPEYSKPKFLCPRCGVVAKQEWEDFESLSKVAGSVQNQFFLSYRSRIQDYQQDAISLFLKEFQNRCPRVLENHMPREVSFSTCQSCDESSIWMNSELVYPRQIAIDPPNTDLEEGIKDIYSEAASIVGDSPKGAAALLRLALQKVLVQIGEPGKNINDDIKTLVSKGLSPKIQKALDFVRVVGNNAVHPGQISIDDNRDVATKMFRLLNLIADEMITRPKEIDDLYDDVIPDETKEHIKKRDGGA